MRTPLISRLSSKGIFLATNNAHKKVEFDRMLAPFSIRVFSPAELGVKLIKPETGSTFAENAAIKAREGFSMTGLDSLADDSGLCVDALNGQPGIYSARFGSADWTDLERTHYLLKKMVGIDPSKRSAHFQCVLALCSGPADADIRFFKGRVHGKIDQSISGVQGFGYDPVFVPDNFNLSFAQMEPDQKNKISHRARAMQKFGAFLGELSSAQ